MLERLNKDKVIMDKTAILSSFLVGALFLLAATGIAAYIQYLLDGGPTFFRDSVLFDYRIYERDVQIALSKGNPYDHRSIGTGFLYPPPALLMLWPLHVMKDLPLALKTGIVWSLSLFLMAIIIRLWLPRPHRYKWVWYVAAFTWAPFLENLHVGQVNLFIALGITLLLLWKDNKPFWAALAWSLVSWFKLTPFVFVFPLILEKRWRVLGWSAVIHVALVLTTIFTFGYHIWIDYFSLASWLVQVVLLDSETLVGKIFVALPYGPPRHWFRAHLHDFVANLQRTHTLYLVFVILLTAILMRFQKGEHRIPYIITGLSFPLLPNIIWLHHFLLLWPALLLWWTQEPSLGLSLWIGLALGLTSLGRYFLLSQRPPLLFNKYPASVFGLSPYLFVHLSLLYLLCRQICFKYQHPPSGRKKDGVF